MSEPSKISGMWEATKGSVKETTGNILGNERMQTEGRAQNLAGKAEQRAADVQNKVQGATDERTGQAKSTIGDLTGDRSQQMEGETQRLKGKAQQNI